jgi:hypothetical protein
MAFVPVTTTRCDEALWQEPQASRGAVNTLVNPDKVGAVE